ncbi:uncharacterized UDP-glucosyltransferase YdhE-like [Tetranychus urticae]|uniref:UDP-glucuronosyltransferase n=1 Tax=Tetranychus urticae TaxID=32264 RepID=T1K372_TETUR|nr:uncharacterized UDP-glucosyltransferase YdhE-like [Tetranychus urticae]AHX56850.1 UDP-glycosyltransferase 201B3 [Tetranychus urticae]
MTSYRFLVTAIDAAGHVNTVLRFSEGLKAAGHEVYFAHREKHRHLAVEGGFSFIPFDETLWKVNLDELMLRLFDLSVAKFRKDPVERLLEKYPNEEEADKLLSIYYDVVNQALDKIISDEIVKFDAIIVDFVSPSPPLYKSPIPWFPICSLNPLVLYPSGPPPFSGYSVNSDQSNWDEFRKIHRQAHSNLIETVNKDLDVAGLKQARFNPAKFVDSPQTIGFYHYPAALDYTECEPIEPGWCRIDSLIRQPDDDTDFVIPERLKDKPGKTIYFSLGSLASADLAMLQRFISILAKSPHKFIISKGARGDQLELTDNMWGENFVDQLKVMQVVDLVITHGGNNTFMETLYYGKPMIVFPYFNDQFDNAQRVVDKKIGFRVNPYDFNEYYFLDCIEKIFADEQIKNRVEAISQSMRNSNSLSEAVKMIEKQIGLKKASVH